MPFPYALGHDNGNFGRSMTRRRVVTFMCSPFYGVDTNDSLTVCLSTPQGSHRYPTTVKRRGGFDRNQVRIPPWIERDTVAKSHKGGLTDVNPERAWQS